MEVSFKYNGKKHTYTAPDKLEKMTAEQWLQWHRCLYLNGGRMMLFQVIWGMKVEVVDLLDDDMKANILFLTEQLEAIDVMPNTWMIPELFELIGPEDLLTNLVFAEWMFADKFCEEFLESGDLEKGKKFLACIYREKASEKQLQESGDSRVTFAKADIDIRLRNFAKVDYATIRAVANNWIGCKQEFKALFPYVFRGNDEQVDATKKGFGWFDVGLGMVEDNPIEFLNLERTNLFLVLKALNNKIRKDDEMRQKLEEQKRNKVK